MNDRVCVNDRGLRTNSFDGDGDDDGEWCANVGIKEVRRAVLFLRRRHAVR